MASIITAEMLFLDLGLYNPIPFSNEDYDRIASILLKGDKVQFDCFCVECQKDATFLFAQRAFTATWNSVFGDVQKRSKLNSHSAPLYVDFCCQRDRSHIYSYTFRIVDDQITKVGQYPSSASLDDHTIKRYRSILKEDYREFSKAIGLFSHGIGAGSFVYLRRIFENLIEESKLEALKHSSLDENKFQQSKMDEKIKMLEEFLPAIVVQNRKLYSILSKGIHELSEEQCLSLFPDVKLAIELILDAKMYLIEQQKKIKSSKNFVAKTVDLLRN